MAMVQVKSYNFATVENPLSNGGVFTSIVDADFTGALKVITGNICEAVTAGSPGGSYYSGPLPSPGGTWPNDHYAEMTITTHADSMDVFYLVCRQGAFNSGTQYIASLGANGVTVNLFAIVSGSANTLATWSQAWAQGDVVRLAIAGNVISFSINGSIVQTFTDTNNYITSGAPGFGINGASAITDAQTSLVAFGANQAATPTFSPNGGTFSGPQTVTITSTSGGTIYYTTDGTTPTHSSSSISSGGTITVGTACTVKAIASATNMVDSAAGSAAFVIVVPAATPTFSPNGGNFNSPVTVTVSSTTSGGTIYYTTDGTAPTHESSSISNGGTITLSSSATVSAILVASGFDDSAIASVTFVVGAAVTLTGKISGISGASQAGTVTATLSNYAGNPPIITGAVTLAPITLSTIAASDGTWSLTLWGNDQITPLNTFYTIAITPAGSYAALWIAEYLLLSGSYDLSTLSPIAVLPQSFIPRGPQGPAGPQGQAGVGMTVEAASSSFSASAATAYLVTTGTGTISATLPTAIGISSESVIFKKVDSGTGTIDILTTASQTIDGLSMYQLTNQYQYVEVISDGSNWNIVGGN